jgi:hypothetical protein
LQIEAFTLDMITDTISADAMKVLRPEVFNDLENNTDIREFRQSATHRCAELYQAG